MKKEYIKYGSFFLVMLILSMVIIALVLNGNHKDVESTFDFAGEFVQFVFKEDIVFLVEDDDYRSVQGNEISVKISNEDIARPRIVLSGSFIDNKYKKPIEIKYDGENTIQVDVDFLKKDIVWNEGFLNSKMFSNKNRDNYDIKIVFPLNVEVSNSFIQESEKANKVIFSYKK